MKTTLTILSLIVLSIGAYLWLKKTPDKEPTTTTWEKVGTSTIKTETFFEVPVEECGAGEKCF